MELLTAQSDNIDLAGKDIFLDNDFLGLISSNEDALSTVRSFFSESRLAVDRVTAFEFLRDMILPEKLAASEKFLANEFLNAPDTNSLYDVAIADNALLLSRIYRQAKAAAKISMPDLFLAARAMLHAGTTLIVTGNAKDFPECVFDLVGCFCYRQGDGSTRSFSILGFNRERFMRHYENLKGKKMK